MKSGSKSTLQRQTSLSVKCLNMTMSHISLVLLLTFLINFKSDFSISIVKDAFLKKKILF